MIYFTIFILFLFCVIKFDIYQETESPQKWYNVELVILILLAGLRYRVGGDTLVYIQFFEDYPDFLELSNFDFSKAPFNPLWYIYNAIIKSVFDDFIFFQIVQSIIVNIIFFYFFKKYTKYYFTAAFIYYCGYYLYFNMEILREILCICIFMLAYPLLRKRKYLLYYLVCFIALSIHFSSIILFLIPLLMLLKRESFILTFIGMLIVLVFLYFIDIVPFILSFMLDGQMLILAEHYLSAEPNLKGMIYQFILCSPILILMFVRNKSKIDSDVFIGKLMMLCAIIYVFSMYIEGFWRLVNYFIPFYIIYIVNTIYYFRDKWFNRQVSCVLVGLSCVLFTSTRIYYYAKDYSDYYPNARFYHIFYPYRSILNPEIDDFREEFLENYRDLEIKI